LLFSRFFDISNLTGIKRNSCSQALREDQIVALFRAGPLPLKSHKTM
jgi:hypothetical protein